MLAPHQHQHPLKQSEYSKYVIQSSDVIEDSRIYVREESSERVFWYKERFLTDDEIVENVVNQENATSKICWTIHRPKRGWYIRIRAPTFPPGASIPLTPMPASSPFHAEAALTFSTRINPQKRKDLSLAAASATVRSVSPPSDSTKSSMETVTSSSETVVHSYPPTPSPTATAVKQPPSPATVHAKLDTISASQKPIATAAPVSAVKQFLLAPHSSPHVPQPEDTSLLTKALSMLKNNKPSHSLSFTLCPLPSSDLSSPSSSDVQQSSPAHIGHFKRHSLARLGEIVPPSPPSLFTFHDRTPVWNFGSNTGLLEINIAMEREFGVDRSFWITLALVYMEFLTERESYLAAAGG